MTVGEFRAAGPRRAGVAAKPEGLAAVAGCATTAGGPIVTRVCCTACGGILTAAFATGAALRITVAGTTVAAVRFANRWFTTCGGGAPFGRDVANWLTRLMTLTLTLVMLTLRI
jgi:hypothetical protein